MYYREGFLIMGAAALANSKGLAVQADAAAI
jgi:hypothetical protein